MIPIGTRVQRVNAPIGNGRVGMIAGGQHPTVGTYLVTFDIGMSQYWSPQYFKVLELGKPPKPSWEV